MRWRTDSPWGPSWASGRATPRNRHSGSGAAAAGIAFSRFLFRVGLAGEGHTEGGTGEEQNP